jgi:hypothetical protein
MKRIKLTVPAEVLMTAKLASQAMDPDVGGYHAFEAPDEATGLYSYTVNVSDEYLQAFDVFKDYPAYLQQSIALDFETRFPDAEPPTLADCEAFTAALVIEVVE